MSVSGHDIGHCPRWKRKEFSRLTVYRVASLIRNSAPLGPFSGICLGPYGGPGGEGCFLCARYPCSLTVQAVRDVWMPAAW